MKNRKIQLRLIPDSLLSKRKVLQYRILPSELNWFQRIFNRWKNIYHYFGTTENRKPDWGCWIELRIYPNGFSFYKNVFKTKDDIIAYEDEQNKKYEADILSYNKMVDEYNKIEY